MYSLLCSPESTPFYSSAPDGFTCPVAVSTIGLKILIFFKPLSLNVICLRRYPSQSLTEGARGSNLAGNLTILTQF